jgi:hypothetical protein
VFCYSLHTIYFQTGLQVGITMISWNANTWILGRRATDSSSRTALHSWWRPRTSQSRYSQPYQSKVSWSRIGRGDATVWPPRSPDFSPLDSYLRGHLKSTDYSSSVGDGGSLRNWILSRFQTIRGMPGLWYRLRLAQRRPTEACIQAGGGHMEHLPWRTVKSWGPWTDLTDSETVHFMSYVRMDDSNFVATTSWPLYDYPSITTLLW